MTIIKEKPIMTEQEALEAILQRHGYTDTRWARAQDIVVAEWVRLKCLFGCPGYGKNASCPPNLPSVAECRAFFAGYRRAVILHFEKTVERPEDRGAWGRIINQGLLQLEREVFLAGYYKAFMLTVTECCICKECTGSRASCRNPKASRPCPEGLAVDVFTTVRALGYPLQVLQNPSQTMNRYAFLMID